MDCDFTDLVATLIVTMFVHNLDGPLPVPFYDRRPATLLLTSMDLRLTPTCFESRFERVHGPWIPVEQRFNWMWRRASFLLEVSCLQEELSKCLEHEETFGRCVMFVTDMISQPMLPETIVLPARVSAPGHIDVLIDVCNACGVKIHDHNRSSHVVLLPCSHAYHAFCYAHLVEKGKCLLKDCPRVISVEDQSLLKKKPLEPCPITESSCFKTAGKYTGNDAVMPAYKTSMEAKFVDVLLDESVLVFSESSCYRTTADKDTGNDAVTPAYKTPVEGLVDESVPAVTPAYKTPVEGLVDESVPVNAAGLFIKIRTDETVTPVISEEAMAPTSTISENAGWVSVLSSTAILAYPFAIRAALKLNVFEILRQHGPLSAQQITHLLPRPVSNPRAPLLLDRLLHLLSSSSSPALPHPLLAVSLSPPSTFIYSLLPSSKYFLKDAQGVCIAEFMSDRTLELVSAFRHLDSVIVDGGDGFHKEFGHKISHNVAEHADKFAGVMASMTLILMEELLDVYDGLKDVGTLVDVGGSTGYTLIHILDKYPHLQGINLDQPHIVSKGLTHPRLKHVDGNMLESIPLSDGALLKCVLHDWEDDECVTILKNCKSAFTNGQGKVVVVDFYAPELVDGAARTHHYEILMMSTHGGKLRTAAEYMSLGQAAGFSEVKFVCSVNEYAVLEFHQSN
ncbi:hypothetical protein L7F22_041971 [Adiantum nelumboides]|nr:hypothetical protein [Adiantum nelumboides]